MEAHAEREQTNNGSTKRLRAVLPARLGLNRRIRSDFQHHKLPKKSIAEFQVLTNEAAVEMSRGGIPDLESVCLDLIKTLYTPHRDFFALQFLQVLQEMDSLERGAIKRFQKHPFNKHILVQNDLMKALLIHWRPGEESSIHGHAKGGCVFKVLAGSLTEKRYSPDARKRLLAVSTLQKESISYIDDTMAYHAVGNPTNESAISLHVYTPGKPES
jgi:Cysteine dioxygenase type I